MTVTTSSLSTISHAFPNELELDLPTLPIEELPSEGPHPPADARQMVLASI